MGDTLADTPISAVMPNENDIQHYGVMGMHWGIRKDDGLSKEDKQWKKSGLSKDQRKAVRSAAAKDFKTVVGKINSKPEYKNIPDVEFSAENGRESPRVRKYRDEVLNAAQTAMDKASLQIPPSPSGKLRHRLVADTPFGWPGSTALDDHVLWSWDIVNAETLTHSIEDSTVLAHYGVMGMHWGIRKDKNQLRKERLHKQQLKQMSDQDLQKVVNRMRLEQQYRDMTTNPAVKVGKKQTSKYMNQALNTVVSSIITATIGAYVTNAFKNGGPKLPAIKDIHPPRFSNGPGMPTRMIPGISAVPGFRQPWV